MTDRHLPKSPRDERRLLASALLKYTAICVVGVFMASQTISTHNLAQQIRDTQTEGSPLLLAIQGQQDDIERAVQAAVAGNEQLHDCLTPGGRCYQDQRQRTAVFLQVVGLYATCAVRYADLTEDQAVLATNACVARQSKQIKTHP